MKHITEFLTEALSPLEESARAAQDAALAYAERRAEAESNERRALAYKVEQGRQS